MMRTALHTLIALSFYGGAALFLCPAGGPRRVMAVLVSAVLISAAITPLRGFDFDLFTLGEARLGSAEAELTQNAERSGELLKKLLLQKNCESWLEGKASGLGLTIQSAAVTVRADGAGNMTPYALRVHASGRAEAAGQLGELVRDELGIPPERQVWTLNE